MDSNEPLLIFALLIAALIFWLTVLRPEAIAAEAARAEARRGLRAERDELLARIRSEAPGFILRARNDFEQEYRSKGSVTLFGQEMSPLLCFGYRVGTARGRSEAERRAILTYCLAVDFDATLNFLPADYLAEWGAPMSVQRFNRIYNHLTSRADIQDGRANHALAVQQWRDDAAWFHDAKIADVQRFRALSI
jgi:hypothetical protein